MERLCKKTVLVLFLLFTWGCTSHKTIIKDDADIIKDDHDIIKDDADREAAMENPLEKAQELGYMIYHINQASAISYMRYLEALNGNKIYNKFQVTGWLTFQPEDPAYDIETLFPVEDITKKPYPIFSYSYSYTTRDERVEIPEDTEYLTGNLLSMYRARKLAIKSGLSL